MPFVGGSVVISTILHLSLQIPFLAAFSIRILFASLLVFHQIKSLKVPLSQEDGREKTGHCGAPL